MRFVRGVSEAVDDLDIGQLEEAVAIDEVRVALLFGSHADDKANALSDLDIAVRVRDDISRPRRLELLDELTARVVSATGIDAVDLVDLHAVGPRLGYEICSTGTLLHGDRDDAIDLEASFLMRKLDFQPVKEAWDDALDTRIRDGSYGRP